MKTMRCTTATALAGMSSVMIMCREAAAHPGSHIGADHSHFFGGGEVLVLSAVAMVAAMALYNHKG